MVLGLSFILAACQLGEDESEVELASDITRSVNSTVDTISRTDLYRFILTGDDNVYELEDDLSEIIITGDSNVVTIMEDAELDSLIVNGSFNTIKVASGLQTRVTDVLITNQGNTVIVTEYVALSDNGTLNEDGSSTTSFTGTQVTP